MHGFHLRRSLRAKVPAYSYVHTKRTVFIGDFVLHTRSDRGPESKVAILLFALVSEYKKIRTLYSFALIKLYSGKWEIILQCTLNVVQN
jgi:hypothetical protein